MQGRSNFDGTDSDLDLFRHMVLNSLRVINRNHRDQFGQPVIAIDSATASWRKQTFPYYKAQRSESKLSSAIDWKQVAVFIATMTKEIHEISPFLVIQIDGAEADDVIGQLARNNIANAEVTLIASGDRDFVQLQAGTNLVSQWDNARSVWVSSDDPVRYLFDHVLKGDRGDGIPNVLCDDDHFIAKTAKAPAMTKKKLDYWWDTGAKDLIGKPSFRRNINLIDLKSTPKPIKQQVDEIVATAPVKNCSMLLDYFIQHGLASLSSTIRDFRAAR